MMAFCKHFWSLSAPLLATAHFIKFFYPKVISANYPFRYVRPRTQDAL